MSAFSPISPSCVLQMEKQEYEYVVFFIIKLTNRNGPTYREISGRSTDQHTDANQQANRMSHVEVNLPKRIHFYFL